MAQPRKTSTAAEFPFTDPLVCWVLIMNDGSVLNPTGPAQRRDAATIVQQGQGRLFIAWPGRTRTDLFEVDQPEQINILTQMEIASATT